MSDELSGGALTPEQMAEVELAGPVLSAWGLGRTPQLLRSAIRVSQCKGLQVGEVVDYLGLAEKQTIERLVDSKPAGAKTLEWLRDNGIRGIATQLDEILCIQNGVCYVDEPFPELTVHPRVVQNDNAFFKRHQNELNQRGFLPMVCNGELVLLFGNFDKTVQLRGLGKKECLDSPLINEVAAWINQSPERPSFKIIVARSGVYSGYIDSLIRGTADVGVDESSQVIYENEAGDSPVMGKLISIITEAIKLNVNDVAISPDYTTGGASIEHRISQEMVPTTFSLTRDEREQVVNTLLARSRANTSASRVTRPLDGNLSFISRSGNAFIRLSFIPLEESRMAATSVSMRILPKTTKPIILGELGIVPELEEELRYFMQLRDGLFVVAGPTGSGKSTTIGGMLCEHFNLYGDKRKRLSVEQPVERVLPGVKHIDVEQHRYMQVDNGPAPDKFAMALRALLRHDPDVIFVGEVRDKASCMVTIDAANTGHLVMTTTHANDTVLAYRRLASFLDKERQYDLVNVLSGILAQRLLQVVCPACSTVERVTEDDLMKLKKYSAHKGVSLEGKTFDTKRVANRNPKNRCQHCTGGIAGMRGVHGLLIMTPEVRSLLLSHDENDWLKAQAVGSKITLFDSAYKVYQEGLIELESMLI